MTPNSSLFSSLKILSRFDILKNSVEFWNMIFPTTTINQDRVSQTQFDVEHNKREHYSEDDTGLKEFHRHVVKVMVKWTGGFGF